MICLENHEEYKKYLKINNYYPELRLSSTLLNQAYE